MSKKVFNPEGKFYGVATKIEKTEKEIIVTMPGDFPGMTERKLIFLGGKIVYDDNDRIYID